MSYEPNCDFKLAMRRLQECNVIKYAAYRTAAKLRILQRSFHVDQLPLKIISGVFERHHLQCTENSVQLMPDELAAVLSDIFFVVQREHMFDLDLDEAIQQMICLMCKIFDKRQTGSVQVLSAKVCLVILCCAKPREKYQYLFGQLADHNHCLSRKKLEILLKKMVFISEFLNEGLSFGTDLIGGTVESCFRYNTGTLGITEDVFVSWLLQDPQLLVWMSTLYRMHISEMVCHGAKCASCKIYPIVGLRYRCLRCLSYNQCQTCFFMGKLSKKHKLKHPVQEYCCQITSGQSTKAFLLTLRNKLRKSNSKLQYLPAQKAESGEVGVACGSRECLGESTRLLDEMETSCRTVLHGSRVALHRAPDWNPQRELQSIIAHLEQENRQLSLEMDGLCSSTDETRLRECLLDHRAQVQAQVQRLKLLKNLMLSHRQTEGRSVYESTPMMRVAPTRDLHGISPIARQKGLKMIWDKYDIGLHDTPACLKTSWEEIETRPGPSDTEDALVAPSSSAELTPTISTWLGGTVLRSVEDSSNSGFSWLHKDTFAVPRNPLDKIHEEDKENVGLLSEDKKALTELHADLDDILAKLQKLLNTNSISVGGGKEEGNDQLEVAATEMESLLTGLIQGVEQSRQTRTAVRV